MTQAEVRKRLVDFLLPSGCLSCRRWIPSSYARGDGPPLVCPQCRSRLRPGSWPRCRRCHAPRGTARHPSLDCIECRGWPAALSAARYAWSLVPPATDLVHALKYEGWREVADFMGRSMSSTGLAWDPLSDWDIFVETSVVVPVATTAARARRRGYNQAALLAEVVASALQRPALPDGLLRFRARSSQTTLSPEERRENVRGAFVAGPGAAEARGRNVLLVDDVLTTGATAAEAASTLRAAGVAEVRLLTFGRALPGQDDEGDG